MAKWQFVTPGIPDEYFFRMKGVPMTKEEIRSLTISKLRLFPDAKIIDVGAGSGSISIECAHFSNEGLVYAIERKEDALEVIKKNKEIFELDNIKIIKGLAPEAMEDIPLVDRIFIGGSGGSLEDILKVSYQKLKPGGILVVNSVTALTGPKALGFMKEKGFTDIDMTLLNVAKAETKGKVELWQARNPVQIVSGKKI